MFKWNSVIDEQTCSECLALNGKTFTTKELNSRPPQHKMDSQHQRNCRCYLTLADSNEVDSERIKKMARKPRIVRVFDGSVVAGKMKRIKLFEGDSYFPGTDSIERVRTYVNIKAARIGIAQLEKRGWHLTTKTRTITKEGHYKIIAHRRAETI